MRSAALIIPLLGGALIGSAGSVRGDAFVFPADGGLVLASQYGAVPDDEGDDTAAIQAALDAYPNGNRIVYLPPGVFVVKDTLSWPAGDSPAVAHKRTILQGAGRDATILRLAASAPGFGTPSRPKPVVWTGGAPAQRFRNALRDLTIEVGPGNGGAVALQFNASDQGCLRQVTLRAANGTGRIGLDLGHCDEIGPLLVKGLRVEGFEFGVVTKWPVHSVTFEDLLLSRQRRLGWWNYHQMVFARKVISENGVASFYNEKDSWGAVVILDSHLHGIKADREAPAIHNQGRLYLRNVDLLGYRRAVDHDDRGREKGDIEDPGTVAEDSSHPDIRSLFREVGDGTFATAGEVAHLPVKETPAVLWGDPGKEWANLLDFGADPTGAADASPALQRAIDSGAATVYLPAGVNFRFAGPVEIRGPVQRIIGLEGRFTGEKSPVWTLADDKHPQNLPDAPAVIVERIGGGGVPIRLRHASARTLVVSSASGFVVEGSGRGDLFLEDFNGQLERLGPGQSAWCRQLNSEIEGATCHNAGGKLWILGFRSENGGTLVETTAGGVTEINGLLVDSNGGWKPGEPAFLVEEASLNLFGVSERNFNRQPVSLWVRERQGAETRELTEKPWVFLGK